MNAAIAGERMRELEDANKVVFYFAENWHKCYLEKFRTYKQTPTPKEKPPMKNPKYRLKNGGRPVSELVEPFPDTVLYYSKTQGKLVL